MAAKKSGLGKGLGRGLDALIPEETAEKKTAAPAKAGEENEQGTMVKITKVEPNKEQPRKNFDEDALEELAESIKQYGLIQPIVVQDRGDHYEIIAG